MELRAEEKSNQAAADRELMRRLQGGDEAAFASFYRRFAPGLFSLVFQILQDQREAEDVLQEAFVQMWKKAESYDASRSALFTWAVMISRNKAIDRLRSRQRRAQTIEAVTAEMEAVPPESGAQADALLGQERGSQPGASGPHAIARRAARGDRSRFFRGSDAKRNI